MTAATTSLARPNAMTATVHLRERLASAGAVAAIAVVTAVLLVIVIAGMAPTSPTSSTTVPGQTPQPASLRQPLPADPAHVAAPTPGAPIR